MNIIEKNKQQHYLNPKDFHAEYLKSLNSDKPTDLLLSYFEKIAKGISTKNNFRAINVCDRNACINYATMEAYRKWKKYDIKRSNNIFSFFTTMIMNDMIFHYKEIHKYNVVNTFSLSQINLF